MNLRPRKRGGVNASGWLSGRSWPLLRHGEQSAQMHKNFRMALSPLPDTTEMPTTIPGDVNPPALSHDNAPVSRPEVAQTAAGSPPKPVLRRSERQRRPPKHLSGFVLTKP